MRGGLAKIMLAIALFGACALAQQPERTPGKVRGVVFIVDDDGGRSVIPSVKVLLTGPTHIEVQSDDQGRFSFDSVLPGDYAISVESKWHGRNAKHSSPTGRDFRGPVSFWRSPAMGGHC